MKEIISDILGATFVILLLTGAVYCCIVFFPYAIFMILIAVRAGLTAQKSNELK